MVTAIEMYANIRGERKHLHINTWAIDRDIAQYEREGKVGKINKEHIWVAPRPNIHGILTCLRDERKYNPKEIEQVCMCACHHNNDNTTDDIAHLDPCWEYLEGLSLDGKTRYVEISD